MLEILLLIWLGKKISALARSKGRSGAGYAFMLVAFWIVGEIVGLICGLIISGNTSGEFNGTAYLFALLGAAGGAVASFVIVKSLSSLTPTAGPRGFEVQPVYQPPPPSPPHT